MEVKVIEDQHSRMPDINIEWKESKGFYSYPLHWHNSMQFTVVTRGIIDYVVEQKVYSISEGHGFLVNSGIIHSLRSHDDRPCAFCCVNFDPETNIFSLNESIREKYVLPFLAAHPMHCSVLSACVPWQGEILALLDRLCLAYLEKDYGYELSVRNYICEIWLVYIRTFKDMAKLKDMPASIEQERLKTLIVFINKNFMNKLTLSDIAEVASISNGECCRFFRKTLRTSPIDYLNHFRIVQSVKLLLNTQLSILQISETVGFSSVSYFIQLFKRIMKTTPKKFRGENLTSTENQLRLFTDIPVFDVSSGSGLAI